MRLTWVTRMRLLTHNVLASPIKNVKVGFPLVIEAKEIREVEVDFNPEFVKRMIPKLEWSALVAALQMVGKEGILPEELSADYEEDEELLRKTHHALMEIEVITGNLKCPETDRLFPITKGIPNLLLNENEVK